MKKTVTSENMIRIENYIKGSMNEASIEKFWMDLFQFLLIELFLREYYW